jgi:hypothetical protein
VPYGDLSLRNAVNLADVDTVIGTPEPITFDQVVFATPQTIKLTAGTLTLGGANPAALISITSPAADLTISGNGAETVFVVEAGAEAELDGTLKDTLTI